MTGFEALKRDLLQRDDVAQAYEALGPGFARAEARLRARTDAEIMPKMTEHDWRRFDAMSEAEREAAALDDPDNQPLNADDLTDMVRTPQVRMIRRALGLSQEEFATCFHIPLGTLRDWEQGRKSPDTAARAYLKVIGRNPQAVIDALRPLAP